jgi:hypothetical protein
VHRVLLEQPAPKSPRPSYAVAPVVGSSIGWGLASGAIALAAAALGLWYRRLPRGTLALAHRALGPPVAAAKAPAQRRRRRLRDVDHRRDGPARRDLDARAQMTVA